MPPSTLTGLAILFVVVLPGAAYVWAFEREVSAFGVTLADRVLRFIGVSVLFHLVLGWPEYAVARHVLNQDAFGWAAFAAVWTGLLVLAVVPAVLGTVVGGLYATREERSEWTRVRNVLPAEREQRLLRVVLGRDPAPRAWDELFAARPTGYVRVRTAAGEWVGGLFASASYAGGLPHEPDLLLEEGWALNAKGTFLRPLGYRVYVPASQVTWLEFLPVPKEESDERPPTALGSH